MTAPQEPAQAANSRSWHRVVLSADWALRLPFELRKKKSDQITQSLEYRRVAGSGLLVWLAKYSGIKSYTQSIPE